MIIAAFLFFLAVFVLIGALSARYAKGTGADYLTAAGSVPPWLAALSAVATTNSGYMFVGMIGYTYSAGLSSMWLVIGWVAGDLFASFVTHKKLRETAGERDAHSFAGALARWTGGEYKRFRKIAGIIIVLLLGAYAAAQLNAGGKALNALFGWHLNAGACIGAVIVLIYCLAGGIRASIWTDAAQSFVMVVAMAVICVTAVTAAGGADAFFAAAAAAQSGFLSPWPKDLAFGGAVGTAAFVVSWLISGYGVAGQPHVMVRMMALDSPEKMHAFRGWYYGWYVTFSALTIFAGLAARVILPGGESFDPELGLPSLALALLPDILIGLVIAGLFAAAMSTADSLILSCTAAFTRDIAYTDSMRRTKAATVAVTAIALAIALFGSKSVFVLALISWSGLACAFGPLLTVLALGGRPSENTAIAMCITGIAGVGIWRYYNISADISEVGFGMALAFAVFFTGLFQHKRQERRS